MGELTNSQYCTIASTNSVELFKYCTIKIKKKLASFCGFLYKDLLKRIPSKPLIQTHDNVENRQIIAYTLEPKGSYLIQTSQVLSGLNFAILEEALRKSQQEDQAAVRQWLMEQFQC